MIRTKKSILFIFLLVTILFIGCSKEEQNTHSEISDEINKETEASIDKPSDISSNNLKDTDKPITLDALKEAYPDKEVLLWVYNDFLEISPSRNNAVNAALVKKGYNFVIFFQQIKEDTYESTINNMITGGNAPDIICASIGEAGKLQGTYRAIKNDWLQDLSPYLDRKESDVLRESYPEHMWKSFESNGTIYGVNGMLPIVTDYVYFVNKDIADKYHIALSELKELKPTELGNILEKVYQGENAEEFSTFVCGDSKYTGNYSTVFDPFNNVCEPVVIDNRLLNPKAVNLFTEKDQIDYFIALAEYMVKGYLHIENEKSDKKSNQQEVSKKNFFIMLGTDNLFGDRGRDKIIEIKNKYPMAGNIEIVSYEPSYITKQGNSITGICRSSEKKDMAFQALCAVFSDTEISDLILYGTEGVDYTLKEGKAVPEPGNSFNWYTSLYFGNPIISTPTVDEPLNKKEIVFEKISQMYAPDNLGKYVELVDISDDMTQINNIVGEYSGLYHGELPDVEATINELNQKLEENNIQNIIDEINQRLIEQ